jgi:hypothetical protein
LILAFEPQEACEGIEVDANYSDVNDRNLDYDDPLAPLPMGRIGGVSAG